VNEKGMEEFLPETKEMCFDEKRGKLNELYGERH